MMNLHFIVWMFLVGLMSLGVGVVSGQNYPHKPLRILTGGPGGNADFHARLIAEGISAPLGQQVIVDNRPNGIILFEIARKALPDGYNMLVYNNTVWLLPLMQSAPYDPVRDFVPITLMTVSPSVLVVHPSLPVKSVRELIALAKARPGELNYATTGRGSGAQLAGELLKSMAGVNIVGVPYKSTGPAFSDMIAGRVQMMIPPAGSIMPHVKSGKLRALAVTSARPSTLLPELPTVAASGLPGYETVSNTGIFAPAKTPAPIVERLNRETIRFLHTTEAKKTFLSRSIEAVGSSPEEFAAIIKSEMAKMGKVIKDAGIEAD